MEGANRDILSLTVNDTRVDLTLRSLGSEHNENQNNNNYDIFAEIEGELRECCKEMLSLGALPFGSLATDSYAGTRFLGLLSNC